MRKLFNNKKIRDLMFIAVAIFMSILICITSISSGNGFGIFVSIILLSLLCAGLGYQYCKNEDTIFPLRATAEKEKAEKPSIDFELSAEDTEELRRIMGVKAQNETSQDNIRDCCENNAKNVIDKAK